MNHWRVGFHTILQNRSIDGSGTDVARFPIVCYQEGDSVFRYLEGTIFSHAQSGPERKIDESKFDSEKIHVQIAEIQTRFAAIRRFACRLWRRRWIRHSCAFAVAVAGSQSSNRESGRSADHYAAASHYAATCSARLHVNDDVVC